LYTAVNEEEFHRLYALVENWQRVLNSHEAGYPTLFELGLAKLANFCSGGLLAALQVARWCSFGRLC
jgi:hypothetical protein